LKQNYQIGIYPSATIVNPPFAKILFSKVPDLRTHTEGKTVYDRDCRITADYLQALDTLGSGTKPFFSFLFYDLAHGYEVPKDKLYRFQPSWEFADYMKLFRDENRIRRKTSCAEFYGIGQLQPVCGAVIVSLCSGKRVLVVCSGTP
jgi:membrane-anchored protein YejM (alkaline phosphatase superfamily)